MALDQDEPIHPDEAVVQPDDEDEGADAGSDRSSLTSVTSSILHGRVGEGRRTYAVYGKEEYGFPMDDQELDRIDLCHTKYFALLDKQLYRAPIGENPQRVLDLGCGTGIWCVEMADKFPSSQIVGIDIAPTQPEWVPPNCQFELDDVELEWTFKDGTADFIFCRDPILSIRDFPKLMDQAFKHLKPGGWAEFQCVTGLLRTDDDSIPKDSYFRQMSDNLATACDKFGAPIDNPVRWKKWFEEAGYKNVTEEIFKLPTSPWAKDRRLKLLGVWEQHNLLHNLEGMVMRLYQKALGWSEEQVLVFNSMVRKDIKNLNIHSYWPYYVVYAQKPETA